MTRAAARNDYYRRLSAKRSDKWQKGRDTEAGRERSGMEEKNNALELDALLHVRLIIKIKLVDS